MDCFVALRAPRNDGWGWCGTGRSGAALAMDLITISLLLLVFLAVLLTGGIWIAIALMARGYGCMQFVGGGLPAGAVLATTIWGTGASWTLAELALSSGTVEF